MSKLVDLYHPDAVWNALDLSRMPFAGLIAAREGLDKSQGLQRVYIEFPAVDRSTLEKMGLGQPLLFFTRAAYRAGVDTISYDQKGKELTSSGRIYMEAYPCAVDKFCEILKGVGLELQPQPSQELRGKYINRLA